MPNRRPASCASARRRWASAPAALGLVADVAVRQRDELDVVALRRPEDGGAARVAGRSRPGGRRRR